MFIILEQLLQKGTQLAEIPIFSPEWSLSFSIRLHADTASMAAGGGNEYCNLVHLTKQNHHGEHGDRIPLVSIYKPTRILHTASSINNDHSHVQNLLALTVNQTYKIEIHQRYVSNGDYRYFIILDGQEVYSVVNTDAKQFYNIKVYASGPFRDACPAYVKDLKFTNFL